MKKSIVINTIKEGFINCSADKKAALQEALVKLDKMPDEVNNTFYQDILSILRS